MDSLETLAKSICEEIDKRKEDIKVTLKASEICDLISFLRINLDNYKKDGFLYNKAKNLADKLENIFIKGDLRK